MCICIYIYVRSIQYSPYMVIESSLMYLLPFFGTKPQSSLGIIITTMGSQRPSQAILLGKYGHSPRVGETFCGQARHFIHGLQPTQGMGKPEKACRMSKTLQNQNPLMTPNLDGLLQSHLMRVNGFHLTINRPPNQSQQQPRCFHFGWGLKSSVLCKKKRKTVNVFWFL